MTLPTHSPSQPSGALPAGTRVEKSNAKRGDSHANGALGTVSSLICPQVWHGRVRQGYFVRWDGHVVPVFVTDESILRLAKG